MGLTLRHRLRFAWEITWPMAVLDVAVVVLLHGMITVKGESVDSVWAVVAFFGVSPWIVRRALDLKYGSLRIRPELNYQQSLKVMWLLSWRTLVLSLIALAPISIALNALHVNTSLENQGPVIDNLAFSVLDALSTLIFTPFLMGAMLRKQYRGFRLKLLEEQSVAPVSPERKNRRK